MSGNWHLLIDQLKLWFIRNDAAVLRKPVDISSMGFEPNLNLQISSMTYFLEKVISSKQIEMFGVFGTSLKLPAPICPDLKLMRNDR